jgi:adenine-specific DNA-methyltransferase
MALLEQFEELKAEAYAAIESDRSSLGQFYTPAPIAALLASMLPPRFPAEVTLLDPGAGVGMLSAAAVAELHARGVRKVHLTACEMAEEVIPFLHAGMQMLGDWCRNQGMELKVEVVQTDFIPWAVEQQSEDDFFSISSRRFDCVVMNPPYKKISSDGTHRRFLRRADLECTNLYAGFLFLSARLLKPGGHLISINPRSFANGPYFRDFRRKFFRLAPLHSVHVFTRRDLAFSADKVLQENVVLHAVRGSKPATVRILSSSAGDQQMQGREVPTERVIDTDDPDCILHLEATNDDAEVSNLIRALPATLPDLGIVVSTGRVVAFRAKDALVSQAGTSTVPLLHPQHLRNATVIWPKHTKKPDYFLPGQCHAAALIPAGTYVVTKRFTSKEEKRRIAASLLTLEVVPAQHYALENHLNYFHASGAPLEDDLARGLVAYLNSTLTDRYFRLYNGHTQVNASDLRALPYPHAAALKKLGRSLAHLPLTTENVDAQVTKLCRAFAEDKTPGGAVHSGRPRRSPRAA